MRHCPDIVSNRALPASGQQVTQVIGTASALLKVELDPVVESHNLALVHLANKDCRFTVWVNARRGATLCQDSFLLLSQVVSCSFKPSEPTAPLCGRQGRGPATERGHCRGAGGKAAHARGTCMCFVESAEAAERRWRLQLWSLCII